MEEAVAAVATGAVTIASRDVDLDGLAVRKGAWLGALRGRARRRRRGLRRGRPRSSVERLLAEPRGVLTILTGEDAPELNGLLGRIAAEHPELEVEVQEGGQPHYHLLLSAE